MMFVHDTPEKPGSWKYVRRRSEADACFESHPDDRVFFIGHTHMPGVWTEDGYLAPEPGQHFDFCKRVMINVGSVGQPRDKDNRASYVLLEAERGFRRINHHKDLKHLAKILESSPPPPEEGEKASPSTSALDQNPATDYKP